MMERGSGPVVRAQDVVYNQLLENIDDHLDEYEALFQRAVCDRSIQPQIMQHCQAVRRLLRQAQAMRLGLREPRSREHFDNIDYLADLFYKVTHCQFHGHGADDKETHMTMDPQYMDEYLRENNAQLEAEGPQGDDRNSVTLGKHYGLVCKL